MPAEKGCGFMVRQCAWCLRLIDCAGERLSPSPLPKLYEASHGICSVCGTVWIARAIENETDPVNQPKYQENNMAQMGTSPAIASSLADSPLSLELQEAQDLCEIQPSITQLILELQKKSRQKPTSPVVKKANKLRTY
jgi:hypothetical protein